MKRLPAGVGELEDWQRKMYNARTERLQKLFSLNAPGCIVARECLLVAGAFYNVEGLIDKVETMALSGEHEHIEDYKEFIDEPRHNSDNQ